MAITDEVGAIAYDYVVRDTEGLLEDLPETGEVIDIDDLLVARAPSTKAAVSGTVIGVITHRNSDATQVYIIFDNGAVVYGEVSAA